MLDGDQMPFAKLVTKERQHHDANISNDMVARRSEVVPTMSDTSVAAAKSKPYKAISDDCLAGDLAKCAPIAMAKFRHALQVKASMGLRPPLQWRGGPIIALLKKACILPRVGDYREVLVLPDAAKTLSKLVRGDFVPNFSGDIVETQWGSGFNGGSCALPQAYLNAVMRTAKVRNKSAAALFIDLSAAFSSLIRRLVVPGDTIQNDEELARMLDRAGVDQQT